MMTKPAAELLKKIIKFGQENAKAVKDSKLAQKSRRQLTGKRLAAKLRGVNWKIAGAVLILGAATEAAYLGDKLAERYVVCLYQYEHVQGRTGESQDQSIGHSAHGVFSDVHSRLEKLLCRRLGVVYPQLIDR